MDKKIVLSIISIVTSTAVGVASIIVESRKTNEISEDDKNDIAERTSQKVIEKLAKLELPEPKE